MFLYEHLMFTNNYESLTPIEVIDFLEIVNPFYQNYILIKYILKKI